MTNNELAQIICECTEILATTTTYAATFLACDLGTEDCNAAINGMGKMGARLDELRETINADIQNEEQAKVHHPTTQAYEAALNHIAELQAENAKLRNENAKLLRKIHDLENDAWAEGFRDGCEAVNIVTKEGHKVYMDEIAELRKLASEAHSCKTNDGCCEDCYCDEGCCPIERRMQELGVEVN